MAIAFNFLRNPSPTLSRPVSVTIRGENRVDAISMIMGMVQCLAMVELAEIRKTLALENDDISLRQVYIKILIRGQTGYSIWSLTTNKNRVLESGVKSGSPLTLIAPSGIHILPDFLGGRRLILIRLELSTKD